jgi:hypothetical protein
MAAGSFGATLVRHRLVRQALAAPLVDATAVVTRLLAVQAQDLRQARWAVASRCTVPDALTRALTAQSVVRTWPMRGTLHLVAAGDARWMLRLLAPRMTSALAHRRAQLGLDATQVERARAVVIATLAGGRAATRAALFEGWVAAGIDPTKQRGYHLLSLFAHEALVVQAGLDGEEPTFSLLDEVPTAAAAGPDGDDALEHLARRYVDGHGPATAQDLAWWSGLPLTQCRRGLRAVAALRALPHDGAEYFVDPDWAPPPPAGVHLLAGFDELHLGYRDRSAHLDPAHAGLVCPGANGVFRPTVLVGGRMVGTWQPTVTRAGVTARATWFEGPPDADVGPALQAYAAHLGKPGAGWVA